MDEQLNYAPCGYLSLADDGTILTINETLLQLLGCNFSEVKGSHVNSILTVPSQLFYQLYFFPMISLHKKVDEMYLTLKSESAQEIPVLINALRKERSGIQINNIIITQMHRRYEYEQQLLEAKKVSEKARRIKSETIAELNQLQKDLECKQKELEELNAQLRIVAATDGLTGLKNRRSFQEDLAANIAESKNTAQPLSLVLLDIDYFKKVNDTFGHLTGDRVLRKLAQHLEVICGEGNIAARYGGEEFALILPRMDEWGALIFAERIRSSVESTFREETPITISIGITTMKHGDTETTLQSRADQALYSSKNGGRNQVTHALDL